MKIENASAADVEKYKLALELTVKLGSVIRVTDSNELQIKLSEYFILEVNGFGSIGSKENLKLLL